MGLSLRFSFELDNKKLFDKIITRVRKGTNDLSPAFEQMASDFRFQSLNIFDNEGEFEGGKRFVPLSKKYAEWKNKHYPGKKILELTGGLKKSMTVENAQGNVSKITKNSMIIGSDLKTPKGNWILGGLHQFGTKRGLLIRDFFMVTDRLKKEWDRALRDHLDPANMPKL